MKTDLTKPTPALPLAEARARLSEVVSRVAGAPDGVLLTRHGQPVALLVDPAWGRWKAMFEWQELREKSGDYRHGLRVYEGEVLSEVEAAFRLRDVQLGRLEERRLLARAGLDPVPGGELEATEGVAEGPEEPVAKRRRRWFW